MLNAILAPLVWVHENCSSWMRTLGAFLLVAIPAFAIGVILHSHYSLKVTPADEKAAAIRQFDEAKYFGPAKSKSSVITSIEDAKQLKGNRQNSPD